MHICFLDPHSVTVSRDGAFETSWLRTHQETWVNIRTKFIIDVDSLELGDEMHRICNVEQTHICIVMIAWRRSYDKVKWSLKKLSLIKNMSIFLHSKIHLPVSSVLLIVLPNVYCSSKWFSFCDSAVSFHALVKILRRFPISFVHKTQSLLRCSMQLSNLSVDSHLRKQ